MLTLLVREFLLGLSLSHSINDLQVSNQHARPNVGKMSEVLKEIRHRAGVGRFVVKPCM